ncbi:hypothetical protein Tco_1236896 [Tanacetum coccineum]
MLEKSMYASWESRIRLFIKGKKHGRMMLDLINNDLLVYPTVEEDGQTRPKKYSELIEAQQLQDDCDIQATNIILHGLPPDVYALVNHQEAAKDIWDRVTLLIKGTELSYQEHECRFKFVTDVKLANSLYTTNYDQLYAYLSQHERHANEALTLQSQAEFPQLDYGLAVPTFQKGEDLIDCINKAMAFLSVVASRFPPSNNQLRMSSNPRSQATIQDGKVTVQQKLMLAEAQEAGQILDEEQLAFIANPRIAEVQEGQEMLYFEQTHIVDFPDNKINSDSNIIPYSQYMQESQDAGIQDTNSFAPNDLLVLSLVKQMTDHVANLYKENQTNKMVNESLTAELERYKERVAIFEQRLNVDLNKRENLIDSQMDDLIWNRNAKLADFL